VAACGGTEDTGGGAKGAAAKTSIVIDIGAEPGSLDQLMRSDGKRDIFNLAVNEGLTKRQGGEIEPVLAESFEQKGKVWTFKLRSGVKFHNGQPLTAADVVASYERILSEDSELYGAVVPPDTKVSAVDDQTVEIARPYPDPTVPTRASLVLISPKEYAGLGDKRMNNEMMGTGPYKFDEWKKGQEIRLSAFDGYWGEKPTIKEATIRFSPEESVRLAALSAGEIQIAANMSPDLASDRFAVKAAPASEVLFMRVNTEHGVLKDVNARRAVELGIDKQAIIDDIYKGYGEDPKGQVITDAVFGHDPSLKTAPYDLEQAKQLLQQANAVGAPLSIIATKGKYSGDADVAAAIGAMLEKVGFKVKVEIPAQSEWVQDIVEGGKDSSKARDLMLGTHSNQLFDASLTIDQYGTCKAALSTFCDPKIDELADKARSETDEDARKALYGEIWKLMDEQVTFIEMANLYRINFASNDLAWTPNPDGFFRIQEMKYGG
jgi:peptide/nickel transport system substrate-binding protein